MQRSTRFNRPGLKGSSKDALLFSSGEQFILKVAPDTTTSIALTWTESFPKPDNYRVERSLDGSSFTTVTTVGNTVFDYTDTGRTESTQYWYRIVPILGGVDQPPSNIADTWTVPSTPTGLTATAISSTQINLAWTDVSTGNTAQSIQRRSPAGSGSYSFIASVGATATAYSDTGLTLATQYEYQVAATNPATQSAWSTAANATTTGGGPPASSWTLDFSTGEPWSNGTNYVFSSTASTSRTFVNSSGYVAPCVANLCLQSENLGTTWVNSGSTESLNQVAAPDNTTTADLLLEDAANSEHAIYQIVSASGSGAFVLSAFVKKQNRSQVLLQMGGSGSPTPRVAQLFDIDAGVAVGGILTNGSPTSTGSGIENYGNGWFRVWVTAASMGGNANPIICISNQTGNNIPTYNANNQPTYTGNTANGIYVWGVQVEVGSAPLPYSATTTSSNGIPRLTHNSSGSRLGLLVEGQRTNQWDKSEDFTAGSYNHNGATRPSTNNTDPENTSTATRFQETVGGNTWHGFWRSASTPTNKATQSVFVKPQERTAFVLTMLRAAQNWTAAVFDLTGAGSVSQSTNGASNTEFSNVSASITAFANGWYRCTLSATTATTSGSNLVFHSLATTTTPTLSANDGIELYVGDSTKGLLMWGVQSEHETRPTSYIPTTTASITRQADIAYVETADVTNWGRPGSFVVEYYKPLEQSGGVVVADDDGAGNAGRLGVEYSAGGPRIVYGTSSAGAGGTDSAGLNKIGWAWNGSGAATRSALNGAALDTSLATSFDPTLTDGINLGGNIDWSTLPLTVSGQPNVIIRKVQFWNSQLSAADLNTLTT